MRVMFNHAVKYNDTWHPANTIFEVEDTFEEEMKKDGAVIVGDKPVRAHREKEEEQEKNTGIEETQSENDANVSVSEETQSESDVKVKTETTTRRRRKKTTNE